MAPTIETSRADLPVAASVTRLPARVDDVSRLSAVDGSTDASRDVLTERGGGPQHPFPMHTPRQGIDDG